MRILSIETSCDETAIAILECSGEGLQSSFRVLANRTITQIDIHKEFGGVFPMIAKREHAKALVPLLMATLTDAGLHKLSSRHVIEHPMRKELQEIMEREPELFAQFISHIPTIAPPEIDAIAVTMGPGLEPALWVGINFAKALSMIWHLPVVPVNHMEGHVLSSVLVEDGETLKIGPITFPAIALLVSGGHTELVLMRDAAHYEVIGQTRDDAVGEAFDKVARLLGLPYPGGPQISRIAEQGTPGIYTLPRPMLTNADFDFSFSGLKTAVRYLVRDLGELNDIQKANIAREFEEAAVEVLAKKSFRALLAHNARTLIVGGGVSANKRLRSTIATKAEDYGITAYLPKPSLSTDNALMIAVVGYIKHTHTTPLGMLKADGSWKIGQDTRS